MHYDVHCCWKCTFSRSRCKRISKCSCRIGTYGWRRPRSCIRIGIRRCIWENWCRIIDAEVCNLIKCCLFICNNDDVHRRLSSTNTLVRTKRISSSSWVSRVDYCRVPGTLNGRYISRHCCKCGSYDCIFTDGRNLVKCWNNWSIHNNSCCCSWNTTSSIISNCVGTCHCCCCIGNSWVL